MTGERRKIGCVLVAHGKVAEGLMDAVQGILGKQSGWATVSNVGLGLKELSAMVTRAVDDLAKSCDIVVLSDMPGGSCHHVCQELVKDAARDARRERAQSHDAPRVLREARPAQHRGACGAHPGAGPRLHTGALTWTHRLLLVRIDDRLIHGQVTVAWGTWLEPDRIVLANDEVASTPWRRELYADTDTLGAAVSVVRVDELCGAVRRAALEGREAHRRRRVSRRPPAAHRGRACACRAPTWAACTSPTGKRELLPYVYVDDNDVARHERRSPRAALGLLRAGRSPVEPGRPRPDPRGRGRERRKDPDARA